MSAAKQVQWPLAQSFWIRPWQVRSESTEIHHHVYPAYVSSWVSLRAPTQKMNQVTSTASSIQRKENFRARFESTETSVNNILACVCFQVKLRGAKSRPSESLDIHSLLFPMWRWITKLVCKHWEQEAQKLVPSVIPQTIQKSVLHLLSMTLQHISGSPWGLNACCSWERKLRVLESK
jgi:hypothetical protein